MTAELFHVPKIPCLFIDFFFTDALQQGASQFEQQAGKLKNKFWWKNMKVMNFVGITLLHVADWFLQF